MQVIYSKVVSGQDNALLNVFCFITMQAIYSSVVPGEMMRGNMSSMVQFPSWLGKNSSQNKQDRILSELRSHMCLK